MYRCVIFDMDGTLIDSYEGIYRAYEWTMKKMEMEFGGAAFVRKAIGYPLPLAFRTLCGMDDAQADRAVIFYRAYYDERGKTEVMLYEGMEEALHALKEAGCLLAIATMKKERFALEILDSLEIRHYFDAVCGADEADCLTKADLIRKCTSLIGAAREDTILAGDTVHDAEGARMAGIDFLAVTYGFGFQDKIVPMANGAKACATAPEEISRFICGTQTLS